jgi:hypothetical protein
MAQRYGPRIVTDGLVWAIDALAVRSHPGSGTSWYDLVGSENVTLNNSSTWDSAGYVGFNGSNIFGTTSNNSNLAVSEFTIESAFYMTGNSNNGYAPLFQRNGGYSGGAVYGIRVQDAGLKIYAMYCSSAASADVNLLFTSGITTATNTWYYVSSTLDSSYNWKLYINGSLNASTTGSAAPLQASNDITVGRGDGRYANGRIPFCRLYNRALTADEISVNYNNFKSRFGS